MIEILSILLAGIVLWRLLGVIATLDVRRFAGHPWRFAALTMHWALLGAGAAATVAGVPAANILLLGGVAVLILSDRRGGHG